MIPFDGASLFGKVMLVLFGTALLMLPYVGFKIFIPMLVIGFLTLKFYNQLEARDLRDIQQEKRKHRRQ